MKVTKDNLWNERTALLGQDKGSPSPRLHSQHWQMGTLVEKWEDVDSMKCGSSQICPVCHQKTTPHGPAELQWSQEPALSITAEPQLGTANQPTWTYKQLNLHFVLNTTLHGIKREHLLPLSQHIRRSKHYSRQSDFYKANELEAR